MTAVKELNCPRCKAPRAKKHCRSPMCSWHLCNKCTQRNQLLVFDTKERFFEWSV